MIGALVVGNNFGMKEDRERFWKEEGRVGREGRKEESENELSSFSLSLSLFVVVVGVGVDVDGGIVVRSIAASTTVDPSSRGVFALCTGLLGLTKILGTELLPVPALLLFPALRSNSIV